MGNAIARWKDSYFYTFWCISHAICVSSVVLAPAQFFSSQKDKSWRSKRPENFA